MAPTAQVDATELRSGQTVVHIDPAGCGFIDRLTFRGETILAVDGLPNEQPLMGGSVALAPAGDGTADSLFAHRLAAVLPAKIERITGAGEHFTTYGAYTNGKIAIPFLRQFRAVPGQDAFAVREAADFRHLPPEYLVAEHVLRLPLVLDDNEHHRLSAFGGRRRVEMFRMDSNDERRRNQSISSSRAFQPYWDLGGMRQLPGGYQTWRSNHADTMAYPIEQDTGAPGWADFSRPQSGLTVQVLEPAAAAPWALSIDARRGALSIAAYPASEMPVSGADYGRRDFRFLLVPHASSWPTAHPCELDLPTYRQFLTWLNRGGGFTHLDHVCRELGVAAPEGEKSPEQMEDLCDRLILIERVQPSTVLRLLYRGDAWRMSGLVEEVLGRREPRDLAFDRWEKIAREFLARIRQDGVPTAP